MPLTTTEHRSQVCQLTTMPPLIPNTQLTFHTWLMHGNILQVKL